MHISIYILHKIWTGWWGHLRWCNACVRSIWDFSQEMLVVWAASVMFPAVCSCKQGSGGCADKTQRQNCTENWLSSHFYPMGYTIMFCRPIPSSRAKLCDHTYALTCQQPNSISARSCIAMNDCRRRPLSECNAFGFERTVGPPKSFTQWMSLDPQKARCGACV